MGLKGEKLIQVACGIQIITNGVWERISIADPLNTTPARDFSPNYLEFFPPLAGDDWMVHFTDGAAPTFTFPTDGNTADAYFFRPYLADAPMIINLLRGYQNIYVRHSNVGVQTIRYTFAEAMPDAR